jgi:ATP-dependent helicase HrpB
MPPAPHDRRPLVRLPIDEVLPELLSALRTSPNLVLVAPPGAGKSTRIAPAILQNQDLAAPTPRGKVFLLQPRRLAAVNVAARIAAENGWQLGQEVGYHVRFDRRVGRDTQLIVLTDGMFLQYLQQDPWLEGVATVIFDEFHERNLNNDLALALCRRLQTEVRPELQLLVMSATLTAEPVAAFLGHAPIINSPGRMFPVEVIHDPRPDTLDFNVRVSFAVRELLEKTTGDLLVFLPGVGQIISVESELHGDFGLGARVLQLYGDMPLAEQQKVMQPIEYRRIILSTNVAETSLTIPGITGVIDSGYARVMRVDPSSGLNLLTNERISLASANQRMGRAGRIAPGVCRRLWTASEERGFSAQTTPEIQRVELSAAVLELAAWGENDPTAFPWFERPTDETLRAAQTLLRLLGAIEADGRITERGTAMARLPLQPRLARLVLEGAQLGVVDDAALIASLLTERDPITRNTGNLAAEHHSDSDVLDRVQTLRHFEQTGRATFWLGKVNKYIAQPIFRAQEQLCRTLQNATTCEESRRDEALLLSLLVGFPDRVARRREPASPRAAMVGGRGVKLARESAVRDAEYFVCVDIQETAGSEAIVRQASAIQAGWLDPNLIRVETILNFDTERQRVIAERRTSYLDLTLSAAPTNIPEAQRGAAARLLTDAALARWEQILPVDSPAQQILIRWHSLVDWLPELELPRLDEHFWRTLLETHAEGLSSLDDLRKLPWSELVRMQLSHEQRQLLEREAPERMNVPSGSQIKLDYESGKPPVLAVRVQELFGLRETPRVARGRVPVLLHLLGPNYRPQQVTSDLASFWRTTYPEVKKELRRRYPKHSWPDDPLTAAAVNKGGRRSS